MGKVTINDTINTDWQLEFLGKTISAPSVKTKTIDIPLRDGLIDLTESLDGTAHYNNRKITMKFEMMADRIDWPHLQMELANAYHGQIVKVVFDDDTDHYWQGRASVSEITDNISTATIYITVDAEPYRRTVAPFLRKAYETGAIDETIYISNLGHAKGYINVNNGVESGHINWIRLYVYVDGVEYRPKYTAKNPSMYLPAIYPGSTVKIVAQSNNLIVEIVGGDL